MEVVIQDSTGVVRMVVVKRSIGFFGLELLEALACIWAMEQALVHGFSSIIMERDCQNLTLKLKK